MQAAVQTDLTSDSCRPSAPVLVEQIVERLPGAARARRGAAAAGGRAGLPLDRRARREQRAGVARVFRRDARRQRGALRAFPACAGVERDALHAAVQIDAAALAARIVGERQRRADCRTARSGTLRAPPSDSGVFGPARVLQHASRAHAPSAAAAPPVLSGRVPSVRPDSRAVGTFDRRS